MLQRERNATSKHICSTCVCVAHNSTHPHPILVYKTDWHWKTPPANVVLADELLKNTSLIHLWQQTRWFTCEKYMHVAENVVWDTLWGQNKLSAHCSEYNKITFFIHNCFSPVLKTIILSIYSLILSVDVCNAIQCSVYAFYGDALSQSHGQRRFVAPISMPNRRRKSKLVHSQKQGQKEGPYIISKFQADIFDVPIAYDVL